MPAQPNQLPPGATPIFGLVIAAVLALSSQGVEPVPLSLTLQPSGPELSWTAAQTLPDGSQRRPVFELQRSDDLIQWKPLGERLRARSSDLDLSLRVTDTAPNGTGFYRLLTLEPETPARLASDGAAAFGYGPAFDEALAGIGQISPDAFAARFPAPGGYLPQITWDPTTAAFWGEFNADVDALNVGKTPEHPDYRLFDTRLADPELAVLKTQGFVVSERLGSLTFADLFYKIWKDDLPVFISSDALLHAWHRTFDAMLEETEETFLFNAVESLLRGMAGQVARADAEVGNGVLKDSLLDADWFIAVARSLLAGLDQPPVPSVLKQDTRVAQTLADVRAEQLKDVPDFMGFCRMVDFSQFKPRGHYTRSERLSRYFQCVMWLGRIDIPVAGGPFERCLGDRRMTEPRETGTAIIFWDLLRHSGKFQAWADMETIISAFVGWTDSMNFGQLNGLMAGAGIRTLSDVPDLASLERLQSDFVEGRLGFQNIRSDWFANPLDDTSLCGLPQSFSVFGQKFVPDSWAFSQTILGSVVWIENGETNAIRRRVPGALDVAFSTLGNDQVVPELVAQMKGTFDDPGRSHALRFRDAKSYQHNLAAVRAVMDRQSPAAWAGNIYLSWLDTLRQLSPATVTTEYPEAMRTRAWAMKTLNTQLASWTQLRRDTILYAKQSYTPGGDCLYPKAYVEPRVAFWNRFKTMVDRAADLIASLDYQGTYPLMDPNGELIEAIPMASVRNRQVEHLRRFADVLGTLQSLAEKELAHECFSANDDAFVRDLIQILTPGGGSGGIRTYSGWYPRLFYRAIHHPDNAEFHRNYGAEAFAGVVADVHTDVPSDADGDPGSVLHQAVGKVNLLFMAVDNGNDRFLCAGPVLSHYELEVLGDPRRLSDEEWTGIILENRFPEDVGPERVQGLTPPPWTRSFLVRSAP